MRTLLTAILLPVFVIAALCAAPLCAQTGGSCPNQQASPVPGAAQVLPPWRICFMNLHVLGVDITLAGKRCPTGHTRVVSHSECLGMYATGMECAESAPVAVELDLCSCVPHGKGGTWISACECHSLGTMGFVAAGQTISCH